MRAAGTMGALPSALPRPDLQLLKCLTTGTLGKKWMGDGEQRNKAGRERALTTSRAIKASSACRGHCVWTQPVLQLCSFCSTTQDAILVVLNSGINHPFPPSLVWRLWGREARVKPASAPVPSDSWLLIPCFFSQSHSLALHKSLCITLRTCWRTSAGTDANPSLSPRQ